MSIDRTAFFSGAKHLFGGAYSQPQVDGMNAILNEWESRKPGGDLRWLAYMLATTFHETNQQMRPVKEAYWSSETWRKNHLSYYPYYGRGYVQLTHESNYSKASAVVGDNLVANPDHALLPNIAAVVMFVGMEEGWFRASSDGKRHSLPRYFSSTVNDPVGARAIINGKEWKKVQDQKVLLATIIAQYHEVFLSSLAAAPATPDHALAPAGVAPEAMLAPAAAPVGFVDRAKQTATAEWDFFGRQTYDVNGHLVHGGHTEGEEGWYQRIGRYWVEATDTHGIDGRNHNWYWSAAFISWVMKKAGAGSRFRYSTQHSVFISQGIRDFLQKRQEAGYWTMRLSEDKPAVGDIVCWARESGVDYDHQKGGSYAGHSDVVVEVGASQIWIIGGNVGNSVTRRPLDLDGNGFLKPVVVNGETLFALMKNRIV